MAAGTRGGEAGGSESNAAANNNHNASTSGSGSGNSGGENGRASAGAGAAHGRRPGLARTLLNLPYFASVVFIMYWSLPFAAVLGYLPPWQLWGERNDIFYWCKFFVDAFRIDTRLIETAPLPPTADGGKPPAAGKTPPPPGAGAPLYRGPGPVIYLANHRSWADFFLDAYLVAGRAQMLSRMAVLYAFPWFMMPITADRGCVVFKRGAIADKDAFNAWLDAKIAASPAPGLVVYPEGHRSSSAHSLPLKRGMLHYAYGRKVPVQVVMSAGKERVLSEKARRAAWGGVVATAYAPVVDPAEFADFSGFMAAVQASWDAAWEAARPYSELVAGSRARVAALPRNRMRAEMYRWPPHLQCALALFAVAAAGAMVLTVLGCWRAALWLTSAGPLPGLRPAMLALGLLWTAASFAACRDVGDGKEGGGGGGVAVRERKGA